MVTSFDSTVYPSRRAAASAVVVTPSNNFIIVTHLATLARLPQPKIGKLVLASKAVTVS